MDNTSPTNNGNSNSQEWPYHVAFPNLLDEPQPQPQPPLEDSFARMHISGQENLNFRSYFSSCGYDHGLWDYYPSSSTSLNHRRAQLAAISTDQLGLSIYGLGLRNFDRVPPSPSWQNYPSACTSNSTNLITAFQEFKNMVSSKMNDQIKRLVSPDLIEAFTENQRGQIIDILCKRDQVLYRLCLYANGRKTVEKLLEGITDPHSAKVRRLLETLRPHMVQLTNNTKMDENLFFSV